MTNSDTSGAAQPDSEQLKPHAGPAHRILVVDADGDLRRLYAEVLAQPGYEVDVAADGAAGWRALQAGGYHLLITEHELPDLTGVELVTNLRSARMDLPVVMAAARFPMWETDRNPPLQLAATLMKPFGIDTLLSTVKSALSGPTAGPDNSSGSFPESA